MINGERLKVFPIRSGTRQGGPLPKLLFNIVLEVLHRAIRSGIKKKKKSTRSRKEEIEMSTFAVDMILDIQNPKGFTKKKLDLINKFSEVPGHKRNNSVSIR